MVNQTLTRGERNNNPGNIRKSSTKWKGLAFNQPDSIFCSFTTPEFGIRAIGKIVRFYQTNYKLDTITAIIGRWAPPVENNTLAYVTCVAEECGVDKDDKVDLANPTILAGIVKAIIHHENGRVLYSDTQISDSVKGIA